VFVPPTPVATSVARGLLPEVVPHADAAANTGRAALLVAALAGRPEYLLTATRDLIHQDQREPAMPTTLALVRELRAAGVPAVVSGAGPTVLALVDSSSASLADRCPEGWAHHRLAVEARGAQLS
jgi:homoserine kinase